MVSNRGVVESFLQHGVENLVGCPPVSSSDKRLAGKESDSPLTSTAGPLGIEDGLEILQNSGC